jgi:hypothetical protein
VVFLPGARNRCQLGSNQVSINFAQPNWPEDVRPEDLTMTITRLILLGMAVFVVLFAARFFLSSRK